MCDALSPGWRSSPTFAAALAVMYAIKGVRLLRVSSAGEIYGLDLHEHGISAYPEYMISPVARPTGMTFEEPVNLKPAPAGQLSVSETS